MEITTVETWLPIFSGFYGTIWESDGDEEREIEYINETRIEKGLKPISWDYVEWDYDGYKTEVIEGVTRYIARDLKELGLIAEVTFQELRSPREYNFSNDSINVAMKLAKQNVIKIGEYLKKNQSEFEEYIKDRYTSRSGFFSSYPNDVNAWLGNLGATLAHGHMLGSVLNFILSNENGQEYEQTIHENISRNGVCLQVKNYDAIVGAIK